MVAGDLDCSFWSFLEGSLNKTANEYWIEVAIPHVLSPKL